MTDTATMCVFDPQRMRHRLADDADWWSIPAAEIEEANNGNAAFVNLGADGRYFVTIAQSPSANDAGPSVLLAVQSGRIFVGAGEEVTADGLEPECVRGGEFIELPPGTYRLAIRRLGPVELTLNVARVNDPPQNMLDRQIRV